MTTKLKEGEKAPDFAVPDGEGNVVRLKDLRGKKVVLYFYPKDDTPGCTKQLIRALAGQPFAWASRLQAPRPAPRKSCVPHVGSSRRRAHAPKSVASSGSTLREGSLRAKSFSSAPAWKKPSRSRLVFSPIACAGSKTGFYSDDFEKQHYKAPEGIRKANLCGADLRGAVWTKRTSTWLTCAAPASTPSGSTICVAAGPSCKIALSPAWAPAPPHRACPRGQCLVGG